MGKKKARLAQASRKYVADCLQSDRKFRATVRQEIGKLIAGAGASKIATAVENAIERAFDATSTQQRLARIEFSGVTGFTPEGKS